MGSDVSVDRVLLVDKYYQDGNVAVLYSPGYGAGWSTWADNNNIGRFVAMDRRVVSAFLSNGPMGAINVVNEILGDGYFYTGGADDLEIAWLEEGTVFKIDEYDGSESISVAGHEEYMTA